MVLPVVWDVAVVGQTRPTATWFTDAADYCAYPVTSVEAESTRAVITEGLREA